MAPVYQSAIDAISEAKQVHGNLKRVRWEMGRGTLAMIYAASVSISESRYVVARPTPICRIKRWLRGFFKIRDRDVMFCGIPGYVDDYLPAGALVLCRRKTPLAVRDIPVPPEI